MQKFLIGLVAALVVTMGAPVPVEAAQPVDGFRTSASKIAKQIHCKNPRRRDGGDTVTYSSLVCNLKGKRVNVITFKNKRQQRTWLGLVFLAFPRGKHYTGVGRGVVIIAKNGNRPAARVGARAVHGFVYTI